MNVDISKLSQEKRQKELTQLVYDIEKNLEEGKLTIGEWNLVRDTIDRRQNALLISQPIKHVK